MDTFEKNFTNLTHEQGRIRIPGIQRDYAEGRKNKRVNEIRKLFLNELLKIIFSPSGEKLHLDFVYGYDRDGAFEPLDGQQRLTTLFLLHWFFCPEEKKSDLQTNGKAYLSYATRQSTIDFCNELVLHDSKQIIGRWEQYRQKDKENKDFPLSQFIMKLGWFKWQWRYDPSILSMLVVIEDIAYLINANNYESPQYENLQNITFHLLDLAEFDMGDELYVKMNARGKQLSSFDIMKSILEEEIQLQDLSGSTIENQWRTQIDGIWINYFWQVFCRDKTNDSIQGVEYKDVESKVEMQLKRLLQRMICIQFYNREGVNYEQWMIGKQYEFDNVISRYCDLAWKRRTIEKNASFPERLDFECLINDLNNLFYNDAAGNLHNATDLLDVKWLPKKMIWDEYMAEPDRDLQVAFYAMVAFLRIHPAKLIFSNEALQSDFSAWIRFVRNVVILRNTNDRIDDTEKQRNAVIALQDILNRYKSENKTILEIVSSLKNLKGIENAPLEEERIKAQCRLSTTIDWKKEFETLEANEYLWGQLIAPIRWSMQGNIPNIQKFKEYSNKLQVLFPIQDPNLFRAALLCIANYGDWKKHGDDLFLGEANFHRDRSIKRFLRSRESNYAEVLRQLIDIWNNQFPNCLSFNQFFDELKMKVLPQITQEWRRYIILQPTILEFSINSKLWYNQRSGHMFLRQKQQSDTQHREIFLAYLMKVINTESNKVLKDWYPENNESNSLSIKEYNLRVGLADKNGKYLYSDNNTQEQELYSDEILQKVKSLGII